MGRVFVAGSINMDVVATAERHPRIGETVAGKQVLYFPGGKGANQAVAAAKLGAATTLIGRLGADAFGEQLRTFLAAQGIDLSSCRETAYAHTGTAIITVADADNTIVVVPGANAMLNADDVAEVPLAEDDVAVSQFEIPLPAIAAFFQRARAAGATTILNPAPAIECGAELLDLVDILVLNESELGFLAGKEFPGSNEHGRLVEAARSLRHRRQDRLRDARRARRAGADRRQAVADPGTQGAGRRHHRRRRLLCRRVRGTACERKHNSLCAGLRQRRGIDLRAADGRRAVDADGRRGECASLRSVPANAADDPSNQVSAPFRSKPASAACSGVIERLAPSNRRPNMWSPARLTDSMPTRCPDFVAERGERALLAVAAHHDAVISGGQAHHLQLVGALVAPEPRHAVIDLVLAGQPRRNAARVVGGVLHGLQPQRAAEAVAGIERAVADRGNVRSAVSR